jgi:carbon starvation protein
VLVIAVFSIFAARTFIKEPDIVVPSLGLIPVAVLIGHLLYRTPLRNDLVTLLGIGLLIVTLVGGVALPVELPTLFGIGPENEWIVILLAYCFVASVTPVQVLLQPRDYLASFLLFAAIGVGVVSVFITRPAMQATALSSFQPADWPEAGPLWPMLFVTIACGAISGFHSLVSSGTTCKQLANEAHACRIGYGGMITEGLVGVLVVISVGAALSIDETREILTKGGGPIAAFSRGYGEISLPLLGRYGDAFAAMALNAFILTTLDTSTRIGRYLTSDLFGIDNKYLATAIVIGAGAGLAFTGQWNLLWPAFGTSNQLIAALALLVGSCWLMRRGRSMVYTLVPACIMIATTLIAFLYQLHAALTRVDPVSGGAAPNWFLAGLVTLLIALALVVFWEGAKVLRQGWRQRPATL